MLDQATASPRNTQLARHRFTLLDAIARDQRVTPSAFRLVYIITGFVNRTSGDAWPGQQRLAREFGVSVRTIQRDTEQLVALGYLTITRSRGRGRTNRYRLAATGPSPQGEIFQPQEKTEARSRARHLDLTAFESFWESYPRKIDKAAAQKAYSAVLRAGKATALELLEGSQRYAHERTGQDQKYTKHAATWLSKESWKNEAEAAPPVVERGAMSAVAGIMNWNR
jgi:DNA-binding MarR family transcriptional regulator